MAINKNNSLIKFLISFITASAIALCFFINFWLVLVGFSILMLILIGISFKNNKTIPLIADLFENNYLENRKYFEEAVNQNRFFSKLYYKLKTKLYSYLIFLFKDSNQSFKALKQELLEKSKKKLSNDDFSQITESYLMQVHDEAQKRISITSISILSGVILLAVLMPSFFPAYAGVYEKTIWRTLFTEDEKKVIGYFASKQIRKELSKKDLEPDWHNIIRSYHINDGAIEGDDIEEQSVPADKIIGLEQRVDNISDRFQGIGIEGILDMEYYKITNIGSNGSYFTETGGLILNDQLQVNSDIIQNGQRLDDTYVNIAGDVMTGHLTLSADPEAPLHAVTKQYLDNQLNALSSDSLWEENGDDIYYDSGKVGIGTDSPEYGIEIGDGAGNSMAINRPTSGSKLVLDYNTHSAIIATSGPDPIKFNTNSLSDSPVMVIYENKLAVNSNAIGSNNFYVDGRAAIGKGNNYRDALAPEDGLIVQGNVGIGTNNPTEKLKVEGNLLVSNYLKIKGGATYLRSTNQVLELLGSSSIAFRTNSTGDETGWGERMRIDKDGLVGIGTGSPNARLTVNSDSTSSSDMAFGVYDGDDDVLMSVLSDGKVGIGTDGPEKIMHLKDSSGTLMRLDVTDANAMGVQSFLEFRTNTISSPDLFGKLGYKFEGGALSSNRQFQIYVSNGIIPKMVVADSGNVGISNSTPDRKMDILDSTFPQFRLTHTDNLTYTDFQTDASGNLLITPTGGQAYINGSLITTSDRTKKKNISDLDYGLEDLLKLRAVDYKWKNNGERDIGFIAQEVTQIIPEIVHGVEGETLGISYSNLTALAIKAIQEQQVQIEALKMAVNDQDERVEYLSLSFESKNETQDEELVKLGEDVVRLGEKNSELVEENRELNKKIESLEEKNEDLEDENEDLGEEVEDLKKEMTLKVQFDENSSGKGVIKAGETKLKIDCLVVDADSKITITASSNTYGETLFYDNLKAGESFEVKINEAVKEDIKFDWLVVSG